MSDSSNGKENTANRDEQEMKKCDNRSNLCAAGSLLCLAVSAALFFFVSPIACIVVVFVGVVAAGIGVYQACQFREYRKKVENAKKDNGCGKSNVVSKERDQENIVKLDFSSIKHGYGNNLICDGITNVGDADINSINSCVKKDVQKGNTPDETRTNERVTGIGPA